MDSFLEVVAQLGGGLSAFVIAGLAYAYWTERKRSADLSDKLISMNGDLQRTMTDLAAEIRTLLRGIK